MRRSGIPVVCIGHGENGCAIHAGRDKHGLVSGKDRLAESHSAAGVVDGGNSADSVNTVVPAWVRLGDLSRLVAVETSVQGLGVDVGGAWLPLVHNLA